MLNQIIDSFALNSIKHDNIYGIKGDGDRAAIEALTPRFPFHLEVCRLSHIQCKDRVGTLGEGLLASSCHYQPLSLTSFQCLASPVALPILTGRHSPRFQQNSFPALAGGAGNLIEDFLDANHVAYH